MIRSLIKVLRDSRMKTILTDQAPKPLGTYSQATIAPVGTRTVQLCGQIPLRPDGSMANESIDDQIHQVFRNIRGVAEAVSPGTSTKQITKLNVYLTDLQYLAKVNEIMPQYFQPPYPARSAVGVSSLVASADIEIDGVMYV